PWAPPGVVGVGVEVVGTGAAVVVVSPAALSFSLPKTITAESIATTKRAQTRTYQPMPRPGKFAFRRDSRSAETTANAMNAPPTTARPVFWPLVSAATTSDVDCIGAGTYPNYEVAVAGVRGRR